MAEKLGISTGKGFVEKDVYEEYAENAKNAENAENAENATKLSNEWVSAGYWQTADDLTVGWGENVGEAIMLKLESTGNIGDWEDTYTFIIVPNFASNVVSRSNSVVYYERTMEEWRIAWIECVFTDITRISFKQIELNESGHDFSPIGTNESFYVYWKKIC